MRTPVNAFKAALRQDSPQIGLWVGLTDPVCVEIAAGAGFDWLLLDGEHAPHDLRSLLSALQVIAGYPVQPIVRIPVDDPTVIKRVLDIGAQSLLVPMVDTADQARRLVAATRYPPRGMRGIGTSLARAARWNRAGDYLERADAEMCVIAQIETARGLDNIEEIAAVDGIDALFVGPADLAASLGHPGNPGHLSVQQAIQSAFIRAQAAGKPVGSLSADAAVARNYLRLGCRFVALGTDTGLLANATRDLAARFRGAGTEGPSGPAGGAY